MMRKLYMLLPVLILLSGCVKEVTVREDPVPTPTQTPADPVKESESIPSTQGEEMLARAALRDDTMQFELAYQSTLETALAYRDQNIMAVEDEDLLDNLFDRIEITRLVMYEIIEKGELNMARRTLQLAAQMLEGVDQILEIYEVGEPRILHVECGTLMQGCAVEVE